MSATKAVDNKPVLQTWIKMPIVAASVTASLATGRPAVTSSTSEVTTSVGNLASGITGDLAPGTNN